MLILHGMKKIDLSNINNWPSDVAMGMADISDKVPQHLFSDHEWIEYKSFKNEGRKAEYVSARRLFWFLLDELNIHPEQVSLRKEVSGRPYAEKEGRRFFVSFSHSSEKVFCAVSLNRNIGIDVERENRIITEPVLNRICNKDEGSIKENVTPLQIWTVKEAVVKCLGSGLRTNLRDLTISVDKKNRLSVRFNNESLFEICSLKQSQHQIALAYQSQPI